MAIYLFSCSVQNTWNHSEIFFSYITKRPIQCEILLVLPSRSMQTTSHHLHCYHPGSNCHHYLPGYCSSLLLVFSFLSLFYFDTIEIFMSLLCAKYCNGSPISLRVKSKAQSAPCNLATCHLSDPSPAALPLTRLFQSLASLPFLDLTSPVLL